MLQVLSECSFPAIQGFSNFVIALIRGSSEQHLRLSLSEAQGFQSCDRVESAIAFLPFQSGDRTPANRDRRAVYTDHTRATNDHTGANIDHRGVFNDHRPVFRMNSMVIDIYIDEISGILAEFFQKRLQGK